MTRVEARERNRRALLDAAFEVVSRDGYRAKLEEIVERAGVTTGAVYSLFGSKSGLVVALAADHLKPHYEEIHRAVTAEMDLGEAVGAFARSSWRSAAAPSGRSEVSLQITLVDMAVHDPELGSQLAASIRAQEGQLTSLFTGRAHTDGTVTHAQARRLVTALRALFVSLRQGVVLGLAPDADEEYFVAAARALVSTSCLLEQPPTAGRPHDPQ
ncbi:TetR/AcrR family transcriptional regulator [Streptomyces sp. NPDC002490]|uniref:TetR/AcrR family transcriptional regulator n=1 Tax=Streptomyces sp. NPDC002490 TaxID=3154416 RepID=UPI00333067BA